jgi:hypothetical protein
LQKDLEKFCFFPAWWYTRKNKIPFMKFIIFLVLLLSSFFSTLSVGNAACLETRGKSGVSDSFDASSNCYTDAKTNKTYSIKASSGPNTTAAPDTSDSDNILGFDSEKIRNGDFDMDDIPNAIVHIIEFLLGVAGTISVVALIYHALQMQINSGITGDSSGVDKAKAGMK